MNMQANQSEREDLITVHQLHLGKDGANAINLYGRDKAEKMFPRIKAHADVGSFGDGFKPEYWEFYTQQGHIKMRLPRANEEDLMTVLENIFAAGNDDGYGPLAELYNRYPTAYSISVGDIVVLGEMAYIVASQGFERVELARR